MAENKYATIEEAIEKDGYALSHKYARKAFESAISLGLTVELEDVLQACVLYMWFNRGKYDPDKGLHTTWIVWQARGASAHWLESEARRLHEKTMAAKHDTMAVLKAVYEEPEAKEKIFGELERYLRPAERKFLTLYYVDGLSLAAINRSVTRERNRQILYRIKDDVKRRMELAEEVTV